MTIQENVLLAPYTTLGVGGPARWFCDVSGEQEALEAIQFARARGVPYFILGGGSNLLVSDEGFPGVVVRFAETGSVWAEEGVGFGSAAGTPWDEVVQFAVERDCAGMECLAGIPGTVGAGPVQNIGAYGQELAQTMLALCALDLEAGQLVWLEGNECGFGYRKSIFNTTAKGRYLILNVIFKPRLGGRPHLGYRDVKQYFAERGVASPSLTETAAAVREIRARKGMVLAAGDPDSRSAGSFFKNPVVPVEMVSRLAVVAGCMAEEVPQFPAGSGYVEGDGMVKLSAAWLIERAGFGKGYSLGQAGLSSKHVLAIVNRGGATAGEIVALRDTVLREVYARFSMWLEQEPVLVGF